jgi:hypothetical protein
LPLFKRLASNTARVPSSKARRKILALSGWKAATVIPDAEACGFTSVAAEFLVKSLRKTTGGDP